MSLFVSTLVDSALLLTEDLTETSVVGAERFSALRRREMGALSAELGALTATEFFRTALLPRKVGR
jgi:hypothetical protein